MTKNPSRGAAADLQLSADDGHRCPRSSQRPRSRRAAPCADRAMPVADRRIREGRRVRRCRASRLHAGGAAVSRGRSRAGQRVRAALHQHPRDRRLVRARARHLAEDGRAARRGGISRRARHAAHAEIGRRLSRLRHWADGARGGARPRRPHERHAAAQPSRRRHPPRTVSMPIARGRIRTARGHIGTFEIEVDGYAPVLPSSRASFDFAMARDGAKSTCDLILDLSGHARLFSDKRRDGYLHVDPNNPRRWRAACSRSSDLVGEFEKPRAMSPTTPASARTRAATRSAAATASRSARRRDRHPRRLAITWRSIRPSAAAAATALPFARLARRATPTRGGRT